MPAPVYRNVIVASSRPRRPEPRRQPVLLTSHAIKDDSWMIFGVMALVVCGLVGAFFLGRTTSASVETPVPDIARASPPLPAPVPPVVRPAYAPRVTVTAPAPFPRPTARFYTPVPVANVPMPTPVDYVAKDRRIKDLQSRIDDIDAQILQIRNHPDAYRYLWGNYNGRGYQYSGESPLKKWLDQLDNQRNDLRREKWRLEGR